MQLLVSALQLTDSTLGKAKPVPSEDNSTAAELEPPKEVTIPWLLKHVPVKLWLTAGGLLIAVFIAGIKAGRHITCPRDLRRKEGAICLEQ